jgi:hypothetical protein
LLTTAIKEIGKYSNSKNASGCCAWYESLGWDYDQWGHVWQEMDDAIFNDPEVLLHRKLIAWVEECKRLIDRYCAHKEAWEKIEKEQPDIFEESAVKPKPQQTALDDFNEETAPM